MTVSPTIKGPSRRTAGSTVMTCPLTVHWSPSMASITPVNSIIEAWGLSDPPEDAVGEAAAPPQALMSMAVSARTSMNT
ncbi:MAG: hypothetical protein HND47_18020 [Chloroflexi bacterium]|nr:hypothetical protein [Chloroflexota bacterium]